MGQLISFQDAQIPLRAFRWLPPLPGGVLAAQVLSQNDRQRVALFHEGQAQELLLVLKPAGVADGFWRFASLREAAMAPDMTEGGPPARGARSSSPLRLPHSMPGQSPDMEPGGTVLLLYQAGDPGSREPSMALAVDVASQQVRWSCRGAFTRMAVTQGAAPEVYLYGGQGPIQRLALKLPAGAQRPSPETIAMPAEVPDLDDLLPTGAGSFLASHRNGLSIYRAGAWSLVPRPEGEGPDFRDWKSSLVRDGKDVWWQPAPGKLVRMRPDGRPIGSSQWAFSPEDPFARDAGLLRMLGADPAGWLWFALVSPVPAAPSAPAAPAAKAPEGHDGPAPEAVPQDSALDWGPYVAAGLDRLYRWNPARNVLERVSPPKVWAALNPPATVQLPAPGLGVVPAAGSLLAEGARCAWWLPLGALPFEPVVQCLSR
jgi:hypothetical protein